MYVRCGPDQGCLHRECLSLNGNHTNRNSFGHDVLRSKQNTYSKTPAAEGAAVASAQRRQSNQGVYSCSCFVHCHKNATKVY